MSIKRSAGILLPISSLPSNYGIGTLGKEAYKFIDFLDKADQQYWQILPIGPTSYGDSPYSSFSSYAGNPYFIDLDMLIEDGLLEKDDVKDVVVSNPEFIDYGYIYQTRFDILYKAYKRGIKKDQQKFEQFCIDNQRWLDDYSLFMAVKKHFSMISWQQWPKEDIRLHKEEAVKKYRNLLADDVQFYQYLQYLFFNQYMAMKQYANSKNVKIIGDLPIYVALDSCDVWANPDCFQLDEKNIPVEVAGVPPDYFSQDGQLWGNPLYDWPKMKENGYKWWIERIDGSAKYYDVLRIDHFRGFESYWAVKYGEKTARNGRWIKGPDMDFISAFLGWFHDVEFIAEDLGILSEAVDIMLEKSGLPGMRVVQFGFEPNSANAVHNHKNNCVAYIGTHDNSTIMGWRDNTEKEYVDYAKKYFGIRGNEPFNWGVIRGTMASVANLFVVQMQDYLGLHDEAKINLPGTIGTNWKWRLLDGQYNDVLARKIAKMTKMYGRSKNNK